HARRHVRIERIEPVKLREPPELEIDHGRKLQLLRRQRPRAGRVEAPLLEPRPRVGDPFRKRTGGFVPIVMRPVGARARNPAIQHIDADREESLAAGRDEKARAVCARNAPTRRSGAIEIAGVCPEKRGQQQQSQCERRQGRPPAEPHAAVPPTVSPSMRKVGCPTPTGTPWPSLPQVPMPRSSARSLPIMVILVSASGPLPMRVAPFTGLPSLPFSMR